MKSYPDFPAPHSVNRLKLGHRLGSPLWVCLVSCLITTGPAWAQTPRPVIRYANLLGGSAADTVTAVTADAAGNVYLAGTTKSPDFPATTMLGGPPAENAPSAFVAKVAPSGAALEYSVLLGLGEPAAIALGPDGAVFVAGVGDMPTKAGAVADGACFLVKLDPAGANLVYSTRLGCSAYSGIAPHGLAVDGAGQAFVTGVNSQVATTANAYKPSGSGAFVVKVSMDGSAILYGTYLPSDDTYTSTQPNALAVDADGSVYVTGSANARGFAVTQDTLPRERAPEGGSTSDDVFLLKLSPDGAQVVFAELFGGYGGDKGSDVAIAPDGSIVVTGVAQWTTGFNEREPFPITPGALDTLGSGARAFLTKLTPDGRDLVFSTFLPHADEGACLNVTPDGVDVMTVERVKSQFPDLYASRLLRVAADGSSLLRTSVAAFAGLARCGQGGSRYALAQVDGAMTSPGLSPIGTGGQGDIWYSAVDADVPEAPSLDVNAGGLELFSWFGVDGVTGNWPESLHIQTGDRTLPVSVRGGSYVKVEPEQGSTPVDIYPHPSGGDYTDRMFVFTPGAVDGLVVLPVRQRLSEAEFQLSPRAYDYSGAPGLVEMQVDSAGAPPVTGTLRVSSPAVSDLFGTLTEARVRFDLQPFGPIPAWLTMEGAPGVTPAEVRFTANPAGLAERLYGVGFQMTSKDRLPWQSGSFPSATAYLRVGPAPASLPVLVQSARFVTLRSTDDQPAPSVTVHLDSSTGEPLSFTTDPIADNWIQVSPSSGTTPADVTITITPRRDDSYTWHSGVQFRSSNRTIGFVDLSIFVLRGGYTGLLTVQPMSTIDASAVASGQAVAPGALFYAYLPALMAGSIPEAPEQADAWNLATTLAGYSFHIGDQPVPARSYTGGRFVLQMPAGLTGGTHLLEAVDGSGATVAAAEVTVMTARPQILDQGVDYGNYARKEDGSAVTPDNPAHPGDRILVRVTGQGKTNPVIPDGMAASGEDPSKPLLPVAAYTGFKPLHIVSAQMSSSEAGVLEVRVEVPELYAGDHYVLIEVGSLSAGVLPIKVAARPVE